MRLVFSAFATLLLSAATLPAAAWGERGHRLVGDLAEARLTPRARAELQALLAGSPQPGLGAASAWADHLRDTDPELHRRSVRWHYLNLPADCSYDPERDCPEGECVVAAIEAQRAILADRARPRQERAQALRFLAHLVGDVHQPLHVGAAADRGGNDVLLRYRGRDSNLHAIWDHRVLSPTRNYRAYLRRLQGDPAIVGDTAGGGPADWASESCRAIAEQSIHPRRPTIGGRYLRQHRRFAESRIRLAAVRLAGLLEAALTGQ